jgi:hypothetical protein
LSKGFEKMWRYAGEKQRGIQFDYSDKAIEIMLTLKEIFHLTNRSVEGFVRSLFRMMKVDLPVPDHFTLSMRSKTLKVKLPKKSSGSLNLVMDSTGLKVYGEGEWKVRKHGYSKHRTWCKLHLGGNPDMSEILAASLTGNNISDDAVVKELLVQIEQALLSRAADGAYDKHKVYDALNEYAPEVEILIPPRKNAHIWQHGRQPWKDDSGYHIRSLAETFMFRLKTIFGDKLSARLSQTQTTQAMIRCAALNRMTHLGIPESYSVV